MYQLLCEYEFGGKPWEKHDEYWARSPIAREFAARAVRGIAWCPLKMLNAASVESHGPLAGSLTRR